MTAPAFIHDDLERLGVTLAESQIKKLAAYLDLLLETNQRINLTSVRDHDQAWRRHIIDSLTILPGLEGLPDDATVTDVGAGAGPPGVVVAIVRPNLQIALIESTGKKARFLSECTSHLELKNVKVFNDRAENLGQDRAFRQQYDAVMCRALGPMNELLEYAMPLIKVGGRLLAMKGPSVEEELKQAGDALETLGGGEVEVYDAYPPSFDIHTVIVVVSKERPTPKTYPRAPGLPRQSPL